MGVSLNFFCFEPFVLGGLLFLRGFFFEPFFLKPFVFEPFVFLGDFNEKSFFF
ncbi:hypothetical protein L932_07865 [Helicobacter pylori PZ5026]|nr:hypothetical protein L932_07865 [Helicobacter pylori PZ5026]